MGDRRPVCIDGNEAAARVAHRLSEVIAIYPITPASPMGELCDALSAAGQTNLWGTIPQVIEMQSEAGAAGTLHGAISGGALATTFTSSQGLLLMLPNLFKLAGELSPAVIHVAARAVATHALSIFGDHSDVMAARSTGWAMLSSASVQEAHDFAAIAHAAALESRVPFLHFFDGFRTSHEMNRVMLLGDDDLHALVDEQTIAAHRSRRLTPDHPVLRGTAQNPDVFFSSREAANPYYAAVPAIVEERFERLARRTGRRYGLVEWSGAPDAERALVMMGSGAGAARECVRVLCERGEKVGLLQVRLHRPFPIDALCAALPPSVRAVAVLDRTKEPGAPGEPLYLDVVSALVQRAEARPRFPRIVGGRYGLASCEFTPALARAALDALREDSPKHGVTLGIVDDVGGTSLAPARDFDTEGPGVRALFFGLGSDGTVGATRSSVKIIVEHTDLHAQGTFVYDSKKSGAVTVSHLRFGPQPIESTYLIERASFIACHHFPLLERMDVLGAAETGATVLLNSPHDARSVWPQLPEDVQRTILDRSLRLFVIDADRVAREVGMGSRINTVMQPCFFALAGVLPREAALDAIRASIERAYGKRGPAVVARNLAAVDRALDAMFEVDVPRTIGGAARRRPSIPAQVPEFVARVTARLLAGEGDRLPVSALPADGTFPTGTAQYEKRMLADEIPIWDPSICIDCGKCALVCPHAAIRMAVVPSSALAQAPPGFREKPFRSHEIEGARLVIQVAPDDCTGCGVCADVCPARSKEAVKHKALDMQPAEPHRERERASFAFFLGLPESERDRLAPNTVKNVQTRTPLFEFSGACAGCGETPYLKLLSQLFGDRITIANATGCSSIYGGNLPTTPWTVDRAGRGPAWSNSLFEDNAEFGLGILLGQQSLANEARRWLARLADRIGDDALVHALLSAEQNDDAGVAAQRARVLELRSRLGAIDDSLAHRLLGVADELVRKSVWIVGGDGWAYDIGSGGLDHVLASGRNVNVLVLDTQVYSNTGGQASKATPRGAVAKFAAGGKTAARKDLGMIASAYGNVYVAQIGMGANDAQTVRAFLEADAWPGPSLILAYSTCIAHGIDMSKSMQHQRDAVRSGFWPLWRHHPGAGEHETPMQIDSRPAQMPLRDFFAGEGRFAMLRRSDPAAANRLQSLAQADADERWRWYQQQARVERRMPQPATEAARASDFAAPDAGAIEEDER